MGDMVGLIVGAVLTLAILSYLLGDNVLYRWALALLVGSAVGYAVAVGLDYLVNQWIRPALAGQDLVVNIAFAIPLLLGSLLLLKGFPPASSLGRIAVLGNIPLGYLVGVGAAVAVSGGLIGTLIPQVLATGQRLTFEGDLLNVVQGGVVVLGTVVTLFYFRARPTEEGEYLESTAFGLRLLDGIGKTFLVVALGMAFSGALTSALTALIVRFWQLTELLQVLIPSIGG
ncbi:MAG: hypothetical protein ACP5HS_04335 [Anaerolineae bacterium]